MAHLIFFYGPFDLLFCSETRDPSMKVKFQIVTAAGAKDLDQKMEMTLPLTTTVKELKGLIQVQ